MGLLQMLVESYLYGYYAGYAYYLCYEQSALVESRDIQHFHFQSPIFTNTAPHSIYALPLTHP